MRRPELACDGAAIVGDRPTRGSACSELVHQSSRSPSLPQHGACRRALFRCFARRIARKKRSAWCPLSAGSSKSTARACTMSTWARGRPIVMIHGLGGQLHHMRRPLMEEFGDGYRLIAMDRPGSGYSTRPSGDGTIERAGAFHPPLHRDAGAGAAVLLVGHSLGGAIALRTALDHPDKVAGLALIAPLTRTPMSEVPPEFAPLDIRSPMAALAGRAIPSPYRCPCAMPAQTLAFVFGPQQPPDDFAVAGGAMANLRPAIFVGTSTDFVALPITTRRTCCRAMERSTCRSASSIGDADRVLDHSCTAAHGRNDRQSRARDRRRASATWCNMPRRPARSPSSGASPSGHLRLDRCLGAVVYETGRRKGLKIPRLRSCGFEPRRPHHSDNNGKIALASMAQ
jgi:pimeloyl-ACP methyl ester carboxylesterase